MTMSKHEMIIRQRRKWRKNIGENDDEANGDGEDSEFK